MTALLLEWKSAVHLYLILGINNDRQNDKTK